MNEQMAWKRLRRFQDRAERLFDSAIAKRADLATLGTTMQILMKAESGSATITQEHPPIEEIEAAASKLRPIFLQDEDVHYYKVLSALGYLTRSASAEARKSVASCRSSWKRVTDSNYWAVEAAKGEDFADRMPLTWDRQIARDWLYGYLVHDDEEAQHRLRLLGEREKIMAGLLWVKDGLLLVRGTYQLVRDLEDAGELGSS